MSKIFFVLVIVLAAVVVGEFVILNNLQKKKEILEKNLIEETGCEFQGQLYQQREGFYLELDNGCSHCVCRNQEIICRIGCP